MIKTNFKLGGIITKKVKHLLTTHKLNQVNTKIKNKVIPMGLYIKVVWIMDKDKVQGYLHIQIKVIIMVNGKMIKSRVKENKHMLMEKYMKVNFFKDMLKEKES